jgi:predicted RNA binding protein YcfA (HicA-like mRNA interferase family)
MSTIEKLIARFTNKPRDFSWQELTRLLNHFGYEEIAGGGSRRKFIHYEKQHPIILHEPHSKRILKPYQIDIVREILEKEQMI